MSQNIAAVIIKLRIYKSYEQGQETRILDQIFE